MNWHLLSVKAVLENLKSSEKGLNEQESAKRLLKYGTNDLIATHKNNALKIFFKQFINVMMLVLLFGVAISFILKEYTNAIVILIIVVLNAITGFVQEYRAEKAMEKLKKLANPTSLVFRNGLTHKVNSSKLVPGDLVLLEAGTKIPADMRLIESHSLSIDEASLTGESFPSEKINTALKGNNFSLLDYNNMAFGGTLVSYGRGKGVVTATGMATELGKIAGMLQEKEPLTPLQLKMIDFSQKLTFIIVFICLILFITGFLQGKTAMEMLLLSLSVAVAAIPEALPSVITISLSLGAKNLVKDNALIRRLFAVETLGSVSYICTDKTGTLTQNKMKVAEIWVPEEGKHQHSFLKAMYLNHDVEEKENDLFGDPTEVALLLYVREHDNFDPEWSKKHKRTDEIPFNSERKLMTTIHHDDQLHLVVTKGSVASVTAICPDIIGNKELELQIKKMTEKGLRVIAYAFNKLSKLPNEISPATIEKGMQFLGLAGLIDPIRKEAKQAIEECKTAGIVTVMLTGDHPATAAYIAGELGILDQKKELFVSGNELEAMPQKELENKIEKIRVYASVSPGQKLRIVKALQKKGHFIAMSGDGVNDAPSVKMSNIGIAMGITGTDVTKEAAQMILLDDNFTTIVKAIKQGRRIYDNIRKFIFYILSGNATELLCILIAPLIGLPLPLIPIQILWINLVSDGLPALALTAEPAEKNLMKRPPRNPKEGVFSGNLGKNIFMLGGFLAIIIVGSQYFLIREEVKHWQTIIFTLLCFGQLWNVMGIRSEHESLFKIGIFTNKYLLGAVVFTIILQLAIIYIPFLNNIFHISPLSIKELLFTFTISSLGFWFLEALKLIKKLKKNPLGSNKKKLF
ncbi:cation-translocating P-type ATPase [Pedobacter cryophilus]|uniref:Cation-translocating P-type ATPase n=1 Tax=Pedobacter cryophilus TaxID=2571271 RepID=A0A4U1C4P9_9SPHI|nr:cation-translocating P-type ATPase [Pedobacter cryophilus]TKB99139.1 cation-translocating P-type ATPase [Pedobacter cryophilus]